MYKLRNYTTGGILGLVLGVNISLSLDCLLGVDWDWGLRPIFLERILQGVGYFYCCVDMGTHRGQKLALYPLELELEMP